MYNFPVLWVNFHHEENNKNLWNIDNTIRNIWGKMLGIEVRYC